MTDVTIGATNDNERVTDDGDMTFLHLRQNVITLRGLLHLRLNVITFTILLHLSTVITYRSPTHIDPFQVIKNALSKICLSAKFAHKCKIVVTKQLSCLLKSLKLAILDGMSAPAMIFQATLDHRGM